MFEKYLESGIKAENLVLISAFAEGYYSGSTREEYLLCPLDFYNENKEKLKDLSVSYYELDGKHSETDADINIKVSPSLAKIGYYTTSYMDHDTLLESFVDLFCEEGTEYSEKEKRIRNMYDCQSKIIKAINEQYNSLSIEENEVVDCVLGLDQELMAKVFSNQKVLEHLQKHFKKSV